MDAKSHSMAQQVSDAIVKLQTARTGYAPKAVTVVLSGETLVVTLHEALSPAEISLSKTTDGAAQVQHYHRRLFETSSAELQAEIKRITGVSIRESALEVETSTGAVVHAFTSGVMVQIIRLDGTIPAEKWEGNDSPGTGKLKHVGTHPQK